MNKRLYRRFINRIQKTQILLQIIQFIQTNFNIEKNIKLTKFHNNYSKNLQPV